MNEEYEKHKKRVKWLQSIPGDSYIYFNGANGIDGAIDNDRWASTYEEAVKELAWWEGVSEQDIENDYNEWYYILPTSEALRSEKDSIEYYS